MGSIRAGAYTRSLGKIFTAGLLVGGTSLVALAGSTVGCGSSTTTTSAPADSGTSTVNGAGSLSGSVGGKTFSVAAAFSGNVTSSAGEFGTVLLTDSGDFCTDSANASAPKGASAIRLQLYTVDPEGGKTAVAAFDTGMYTVDTNDSGMMYVKAQYEAPGVSCGQGSATVATGGTVTISAVEADGSYTGTYALAFGSDMVTGAFSSVDCTTIGMAEPASTCI